ncbi:hypothetical protein K6119_11930 [Paracrocinitomix mangrovi]|uniref:hypothetical protein n=1 Tax=Paracrocinitomix mangrovi TaxID=2862509 RepID=UPI001C8EDD84|nr:hypothetical protein [Paracrocinitomix mangrovi]UKN00441.1 hypothetical protein K6119_11930 [Paracrocinitomix mangrovi]
MKKLLIAIVILASGTSFAQTKKELEDKVQQQQKTIDSLKAVLENMENIVENRDRSIKLLRENREEMKSDIILWDKKVKEKDAEIIKLRKQNQTGKATLMTLNNGRATLKVPEDQYWILNQFIADYTSGITTDTSGNKIVEEVHVYLKSIDDKVLTDIDKDLYGPKLYSSTHPEQSMQFPIFLMANTRFTIAVYKGTIGNLTPYEGNVYCSYTKKEKQ